MLSSLASLRLYFKYIETENVNENIDGKGVLEGVWSSPMTTPGCISSPEACSWLTFSELFSMGAGWIVCDSKNKNEKPPILESSF